MGKLKILLVSTGGTIASKLEEGKGYSACLSGKEILDYCPTEIFDQFTVEEWHYSNKLGYAMSPEDIFQIVKGIKERISGDGWIGAVVTQGTATIDETSYLADLLWDDPRPLVFTGAMRNGSEPGWDGPENMTNAILIAMSPDAWRKGVLVTLGGEIHSARDVIKAHKTSFMPLISYNSGSLGAVINKQTVVFYRSPLLRKTFILDHLETNVEILKISIGCDGKLIENAIENGAKAIVLEAFPGSGGVTPEVFSIINKYVSKGFIFVLAPRSLIGSYLSKSDGGSGPWALRQIGVLSAGDLPSIKVRILLMVALPCINSRDELKDLLELACP